MVFVCTTYSSVQFGILNTRSGLISAQKLCTFFYVCVFVWFIVALYCFAALSVLIKTVIASDPGDLNVVAK